MDRKSPSQAIDSCPRLLADRLPPFPVAFIEELRGHGSDDAMVDQELLRGLDWDRELNSALTKGLEITGPDSLDKAKGYLQGPPDTIKSRRESLMKKRKRLLSAKRALQTI